MGSIQQWNGWRWGYFSIQASKCYTLFNYVMSSPCQPQYGWLPLVQSRQRCELAVVGKPKSGPVQLGRGRGEGKKGEGVPSFFQSPWGGGEEGRGGPSVKNDNQAIIRQENLLISSICASLGPSKFAWIPKILYPPNRFLVYSKLFPNFCHGKCLKIASYL